MQIMQILMFGNCFGVPTLWTLENQKNIFVNTGHGTQGRQKKRK